MLLQKTKRFVSALLVAFLLITCVAPAASASVAAKVCSSSARAYRSASKSSSSLKVPKNLSVSITAIAGGWAKVSCKGASAYMPMSSLTPTSKTKKYAASSVSVYNSSGKKQGTLSKGSAVYQLGTINGYVCVSNSSGSVGYVKSGSLTSSKPSSSAAKKAALKKAVTKVKKTTVATSKVDRALSLAKQLLGRRYALSDNPPSTFNCSSFVQYCLGKVGISMKGTAASQAADGRYAKVGYSQLKKGDVLFFDTSGNGKVDHSAIYLGGGKFIEASHNAGKVQINTMTSWYKSHFKWARRPF